VIPTSTWNFDSAGCGACLARVDERLNFFHEEVNGEVDIKNSRRLDAELLQSILKSGDRFERNAKALYVGDHHYFLGRGRRDPDQWLGL
jgi:hypothetical protein